MQLTACPGCQRHVRISEPACPFCGHRPESGFIAPPAIAMPPRASRSMRFALRAALLGSAAVTTACGASTGVGVDRFPGRDAGAIEAEIDAGHDLPITLYGGPFPRNDAGPVEEDSGPGVSTLYGGPGG